MEAVNNIERWRFKTAEGGSTSGAAGMPASIPRKKKPRSSWLPRHKGAAPTCFLRSSGRPRPPHAGDGCAEMARSGCLPPPLSSPAPPPAPHPLPLLIKLTVGSLPLFSFLQARHKGTRVAADERQRRQQEGSQPAAASAGGGSSAGV